ncbi:MAG: hypothetical protein AAF399_23025 [Bacteroidota bacterium]
MHFRTLRMGQGAATAMPVWGSFFQKAVAHPEFAYLKDLEFLKPSQAVLDSLDCANYDFPLSEEEFRAWWLAEHPEDSVFYQWERVQ